MSFRYHGNYCGPGWSNGQYQNSVNGDKLPVDDFDATCQQHDSDYASGRDLAESDLRFARANLKSFVPKRNIAGLLVGLQGMVRSRGSKGKKKNSVSKRNINRAVSKKGGRRMAALVGAISKSNPKRRRNRRRTRRSGRFVRQQPIAVSEQTFGRRNTIRTVKSGPNFHIQEGRFFVSNIVTPGTGYTQGDTIFEADLNPKNFPNSELKFESIRWERYVFEAFSVHYHHACPTTTTGEILLQADYDVDDAVQDGIFGIQSALSSDGVATTSVYQDVGITITKKPMERYYFVDKNDSDDRFISQGKFIMKALTDLAATTTLGHLEVRYRVHWMCRHLDPTSGLSYQAFVKSQTGDTAGNMFGDDPLVYDTNDFVLIPNYGGSFNTMKVELPARSIYVFAVMTGTGITAFTVTCSDTGTQNFESNEINTSGNQATKAFSIKLNAGNPLLTFACTVSTFTNMSVRVFGIPDGALTLPMYKTVSNKNIQSMERRLAQLEQALALRLNLTENEENEEITPSPTKKSKSGTVTPNSELRKYR